MKINNVYSIGMLQADDDDGLTVSSSLSALQQ